MPHPTNKIKLRHSGDELLFDPSLFAVIREEQPELLELSEFALSVTDEAKEEEH